MRSIADKTKNLQVVTELTVEAKRRSAAVCKFVNKLHYYVDILLSDKFSVFLFSFNFK